MSEYETYRVILHACQVFATISIPIIAVLLAEYFKRKKVASRLIKKRLSRKRIKNEFEQDV